MDGSKEIEIFYFLFTGTLAMLLLSVGIIAFVLLYQKKLYHHKLNLQQMETIYQKQLVQSNMEEVENERIRISKDLHDEIGSIFSALSIKLDRLASSIDSSSADTKVTLEESKSTIDLGIKSIRRISHDMIPPSLEMFGLIAALEDLCAQFEGGPSGLPIEFVAMDSISESIHKLSNKTSLVIFRIVQELIQNTLRHSGATRADLILKGKDSELVLAYKDNGKGYDLNNEHRRGIGLLNIESRVSFLQAKIDTKTAPGKGVAITIKIPNQITN